MEDPNLQFPLHVHADGGDYIIDKESELNSPPSPNYFTSPDEAGDRARLKRRRRCGQCGPCQIKENCNKCHYCIRKDVLKQTCIYRKCVYLRSKPKPYARHREHPQVLRPTVPPPEPETHPQVVNSPPVSSTSDSSLISSPVLQKENVTCTNPFLPPQVQEQPRFGNTPNQDHSSVHPSSTTPLTMGPQMHPEHSSSVHPTSESSPVHQPIPPNHSSTQPRHQTISSIQQQVNPGQGHISSPPSVNINSRTPPVNSGLSHVPSQQISRPYPHQTMMPPPPPGMLPDRMFPDMRNQAPMGMPPHMFPSQHPMSFPHISQRFGNGSYPGYDKPSTFPDSRPPVPSQCMYPPTFHSQMPNFMDRSYFHSNMERSPNGPSYFPSNSEMFRQYASLSPGYPYPQSGGFYPQNFTGPHLPGFGGMGLQPPPTFPHLPTQVNHSQAINFPSQSHPTYEQSSGCPKNGYCPPASLSVDTDSRVMQERYGSIHKSNSFPGFRPIPWDSENFYRFSRRPTSAFSDDTSRASMTSSDFECDVISIDDFRMNALIRSDGCNSIEIEIDDRISECGQLSSCSSRSASSVKSPESLQSDKSPTKVVISDSGSESPQKCQTKRKMTVKGIVCLKQDLGDEGIIQLEIPGDKVTIEESHLDDSLAKYSCDLDDLLDFIQKEPKVEFTEHRVS